MASLSISLKPTLLVKLDEYAEKFGYTKSKIAENAISRYLEELEGAVEFVFWNITYILMQSVVRQFIFINCQFI